MTRKSTVFAGLVTLPAVPGCRFWFHRASVTVSCDAGQPSPAERSEDRGPLVLVTPSPAPDSTHSAYGRRRRCKTSQQRSKTLNLNMDSDVSMRTHIVANN